MLDLSHGCSGRLGHLLALTIIVVIVIVLTAQDVTTALVVVGFVTSLFLISPGGPRSRLDGFGGHKNMAIPATPTPVANDSPYPGAIDSHQIGIDDAGIEYDGDELVTYQNRARNVPERVWTGVHQRKTLVDDYVREELDEREHIRWWGAHEV